MLFQMVMAPRHIILLRSPVIVPHIISRAFAPVVRITNLNQHLYQPYTMSCEASSRGGRGRGKGGRRGRGDDNPDKTISKALSWILRHGAEKEGLKLRGDGYANVAELLDMSKFKKLNLTFDKLQQIVADNDKQRYTLVLAASIPTSPGNGDSGITTGVANIAVRDETPTGETSTINIKKPPTAEALSNNPSDFLIRANQGHSIALSSESLQLMPLRPQDLPVAVHGTFYASYEAILASGYLSRMSRNHIHLAAAETGVISGMRADAEVLVFVDVERAVHEGGLKFWTSANGVVLTEGDGEGQLALEYVQRIVDRKNGLVLWQGGEVVRELPEELRGRKVPMGKRGRGKEGKKGRGFVERSRGCIEERAVDAGDL